MKKFVRSARLAYFGNATVTRDFRTQLRGNRSLWLWLGYLLFLVCFGGLAYNGQVDNGYNSSVASLQTNLWQFYGVLIGMIAGVICLVAPGLTAAAVTTERQRRSLDLIFSAPVSPRYFLVGKMISGFRYLLMLLILALPVISVCVVMGGATWADVLGAVIIILNSGVVMMAIGLLCSSICPNSIAAILASYVAITAYYIVTGPLAMSSLGSMMGGPNTPTNWMVTLIPFTATFSAPTFSLVAGKQIPNWVFLTLYSLLFAKFALAAAGSALSPPGSAETKGLRIHGLLGMAGLGALVGSAVTGLLTMSSAVSGSGPSVTSSPSNAVGQVIAGTFLATFLVWPQVLCFGSDASRRFYDDGLISIKAAIKGTPSGGLIYLLMMLVSVFAGLTLVVPNSLVFDKQVFATMFWTACFVTMWWGLARFISARATSVKAARIGFVSTMLLIVAIPIPIMTMVVQAYNYQGNFQAASVYKMHVMSPLFTDTLDSKLYIGVAELVIGILFSWLSVNHIKRKRVGIKFDV